MRTKNILLVHKGLVCLVIVLVLGTLSACMSKKFVSEDMWGIVYDGDGLPLPEVEIQNEKEKVVAFSDIEGRFLIPHLKYGEHTFFVQKEGYEKVASEVSFTRKGQILYVKIFNYFQLRNSLEKLIVNEQWNECNAILARMRSFENADLKELLFYDAVSHYKQGLYEMSAKKIDELIKNDLASAYEYLLLADIYQYHIKNVKMAQTYLETILVLDEVSRELRTRVTERLALLM